MKKYFLFVCISISSFWVNAQKLELVFQNKPLNEVFIELRDQYNLQFSFDDSSLSKFLVTAEHEFESPEKALDFLLKDLPLAYEKSGAVFLIYPFIVTRTAAPLVRNYRLAGQFSDKETKESLPYTQVLINGHGQMTDQKGNFSYLSNSDSAFHVQASYLGYYLLDTLVSAGVQQSFFLTPSMYKIDEIKVEGKKVVKSLQVGNTAGVMRLNHQVAGYLPGNGDNSVFNLLRLQPGVLAAGEQSNDLIIWGSYEGQSQVLFDGFALFGMKNFNDNISAVNPFMAKDIQVMKGGYSAEYGERVGGLVNITGTDGDVDDLHVKLNLNNMTMNGFVSIPIAKKAALVMAVRQTYYELYDPTNISLSTRGRAGNLVDRNLYPDYNFRDLNLKFSGETDNGDSYSLSFLQGKDRFSYSLEYETQRSNLLYEDKESNRQIGFSGRYNKGWKSGARTELTLAYSELDTETGNIHQTGGGQTSGGSGNGNGGTDSSGTWQTSVDDFNQNKVTEAKVDLQNHVSISSTHKLGFGGSYYYNQVHFMEDSFQVNLVDQQIDASRVGGYLEDHFSPGSDLQITAGIRTEYPIAVGKLYVQPRILGTANLNDYMKVNSAWGIYNQYIARSSVVDGLGNYRYLWAVCDNEDIPVLNARHAVVGFTYNKGDFTFSIEAFDKKTDGLTRYVEDMGLSSLYEGKSKSKGLDLFLKQDFKGHSFWVAYTLSQTLEHFTYFSTDHYQRALHDQRHELKAAALIKLKPFFFSANYVYGSGFPDPLLINDENYERDYHRLDVSAVYRFNMKKYSLEAGVSILNVFNYENIKYDNFIRVPDDQDVTLNLHAEAVPFTPTMFLNFSF